MTIDTEKNTFTETLSEHYEYKLKNLPNTSLEDSEFRVGDYVMTDPQEWGFVPEDTDNIDITHAARRSMIDVYEMYFAGIPEITVSSNIDEEEYGDQIWCDVVIAIPDDEERQYDLAALAADAFAERMQR